MGRGKVQRLIKSSGMNDFWQLVDLRQKASAETKNHIPLIHASVILDVIPRNMACLRNWIPTAIYGSICFKAIDLRAAAEC